MQQNTIEKIAQDNLAFSFATSKTKVYYRDLNNALYAETFKIGNRIFTYDMPTDKRKLDILTTEDKRYLHLLQEYELEEYPIVSFYTELEQVVIIFCVQGQREVYYKMSLDCYNKLSELKYVKEQIGTNRENDIRTAYLCEIEEIDRDSVIIIYQ